MVIAVTDRAGRVLALYRKPSAAATATGNFGATVDVNELAVSLARTAAFFSNDQAPLSSRTVRFISGIHFPPGVAGSSNAPLYGIENSNRGCSLSANFLAGQSIAPATALDGISPGLGIATGKADLNDSDPNAVNPGGVPIFENGYVVGGIGVAGVSPDVAEYAAYAAATSGNFGPTPAAPGVVEIGGIALPFVNQTTAPYGNNGRPGRRRVHDRSRRKSGAAARWLSRRPQRWPVGRTLRERRHANYQQRRRDGEHDARRDSPADRFARQDGDRRGRSRRHDHRPLPHDRFHVFSIDVAATKARNMIYFNSAARMAQDLPGVPNRHRRHQSHDRLWRAAALPARN